MPLPASILAGIACLAGTAWADSLTIGVQPCLFPPRSCAVCSISTSDLTGREVYNFQFRLRFDPAILRFLSTENACPIACAYMLVSSADSINGNLGVAAVGTRALVGAGNLVKITFCNRTSIPFSNCSQTMLVDRILIGNSDSVRVAYPCAASEAAGQPDSGGRLWCSPNPFMSSVEILGPVPSGPAAGVEIFDVLGRRLRTATPVSAKGPRASFFVWDGTDDMGRPAPQGVYLVRWRNGAGDRTTKLIRVR